MTAVAILGLLAVQALTLVVVLLVGTAVLRRLGRLEGVLFDDAPVSVPARRSLDETARRE